MKQQVRTMLTGCLTAAMQTPPGTTSEMFVKEPQKAAMTAALHYIAWAIKNDIRVLELGAALAPADANVPPEKMADPVAHHLPIITHQDGTGEDLSEEDAKILGEACQGKVALGTLGVFENLAHSVRQFRRQNIEHVRRAIRAAARLKANGAKTEGVTIFLGRNTKLSIEQNMKNILPILIAIVHYAKNHGVKVFIENCPMCGWSDADTFVHNIANCPMHWIMIARAVEAAGLKGWCYINYDPSHDILQKLRPESSFLVLKLAGVAWFVGRVHAKDLTFEEGKAAVVGALGQRVALDNPWDRMLGDQPLPGLCEYNPDAQAKGLQVDWLGLLIASRLYLEINWGEMVCTIEHEHGDFRGVGNFTSQEDQWGVVEALLLNSMGYFSSLDRAAAHHVEGRNLILSRGKTWERHPYCGTRQQFMTTPSMQAVIAKAVNWQLPVFSDTDDLVLGDDYDTE